ncbi:PIN domain nuclease [Thioalkalivibrio sp. XN8]|uniref:type II toxin-antitoxin system VapC family toxin n=1 Tax=Thioalkalivibrio sp. XN8 TaxID=2712863 RepID=UPI0013EBCA87|nr:PIN domain nuclease [Thioalkalivibrio sp. XN8]NGP52002.1 PIN domain nuclease [Thioalkalivibrio sp. XN8]
MVLVDTSVWIDYFNGAPTRAADVLDGLLGTEPVAVGDLILVEVLQGFRRDRDYRVARELLEGLPVFELLDRNRAPRVADNYRALRKRGVTVRKTTDAVIASFCIAEALPLLYADRDFDPFVEFLGLKRA